MYLENSAVPATDGRLLTEMNGGGSHSRELRDEGLQIDSRCNAGREIRKPRLRPTLLKPGAPSGCNADLQA
jgi:hypothetical protein